MQKAFIFDLDGVIIDDESIWEEAKKEIYTTILGKEVFSKLGSTVGINIDGIYERAVTCGSIVSKEKLVEAFYQRATHIYQTAPLTPGLEDLIEILVSAKYRIGVVSASPREWIDITLQRTSLQKHLSIILSLFDHPELTHKPAPDGYIEAMKELKVTPNATIVLEDSNAGIASAKAASAYTIGLRQNLIDEYTQEGADVYADTLLDVEKIVLEKENH